MDPDPLLRSINLRDLGVVRTQDGSPLRRGRVFRSACLSGLLDAETEALRALGLRTIVDLRRNDERDRHPTPWLTLGCTDFYARDHTDSGADLGPRLRDPALDAEACRAAMTDLYRALPYEQADAYAHLFRTLAAGTGPVLFHCAVGKDRTGVAAALILAALDVPRAAITAEYLATAAFDLLGSAPFRDRPALSAERQALLAPLLRAEAGYLDTMFAAVEARSGSLDGYLRDTLGLRGADRLMLRRQLIA